MDSTDPRGSAPWAAAPPEELAQRYYDATTWIYRLAWGGSFHFAPLRRGERRDRAIRRYEQEMAASLELGPGMRCLDLGCGVGGPARTIAAHSRAWVVGLNANATQLRALARRSRRGDARVSGVGGTFARLPFATASFDAAYAFEALCHAVDLPAALAEVARVVRPGGSFAASDWCLTPAFDPGDERHRALVRAIETSYGVARLQPWEEWRRAIVEAGFVLVQVEDRARDDAPGEGHEPWYRALQPRDASVDSLSRGTIVRDFLEAGLALAERVHLAPRGTAATVRQLRLGTQALIEAGRLRIFTPMLSFLARRGD